MYGIFFYNGLPSVSVIKSRRALGVGPLHLQQKLTDTKNTDLFLVILDLFWYVFKNKI